MQVGKDAEGNDLDTFLDDDADLVGAKTFMDNKRKELEDLIQGNKDDKQDKKGEKKDKAKREKTYFIFKRARAKFESDSKKGKKKVEVRDTT